MGGESERQGRPSSTRTGNKGARQELAADLAPLMQEAVGSLGHYCIRPGEILSSDVTVYKNTVEIGSNQPYKSKGS